MQLGSNDLTDSDPLHVGSAIDDFVRLLHDTYGVKVVCLCQTIMCQGAVVVFFYQAFMSILATWLAIWFSAELGYSSPLWVRSLATLAIVKRYIYIHTPNHK